MASPAAGNSWPPPWCPDRDWAGLPEDVLLVVFRKLEAPDLLAGPAQVCGAWRRATAEPALWRRVDMRLKRRGLHHDRTQEEAVARAATDRGGGLMEAFWAKWFVTDRLLCYIAQSPWDTYTDKLCFPLRVSSLKSLRLSFCTISREGLARAAESFPQLEELELSFCSLYGGMWESVGNAYMWESIGKACPQLKRFRLNRWESLLSSDDRVDFDTEAFVIALSMPKLQELQLCGCNLSKYGLIAILYSCSNLKSLDLFQCVNIEVDDDVRAMCARIEQIRFPDDFSFHAYAVALRTSMIHFVLMIS